ncbi:DUF6982 domain-containing protein [Bryobacter aggregatus]|uniref:DUF6982 domain-containing protein n=1 Tax=Bryobacter aggregatus TaxID=360054 RepID=UPI0012BAAAFE|nr:hypothetical protein [Bryobacter aggregatus]
MVYRFDREAVPGFVDSNSPFQGSEVQLLNRDGSVQSFPMKQIKSLCFVRDWIDGPPWTRSQYAVRPRQQGLWIRLQFRDGDWLEAIMQNNVSVLDPNALLITPPDPSAGVQRVLIPRMAIEGFEVLGVIGSPLKKKPTPVVQQLKMFE